MKTLEEIQNMNLAQLEAASLDAGTAPSGDIAARSIAIIRRQRSRRIAAWSSGIVASLVLIAGIGLYTNRQPVLKDSFSDPYLAYAEVEKAFSRIGTTARSSAEAINTSKEIIDNKLDKVFTVKK